MERMTGRAKAAREIIKARIGAEQLRKANQTLLKYKAGKARLEQRLIASEAWWKMRHWEWMEEQGNPLNKRTTSAWLFNVIINKHADGIQSYPEPNILPREEGDKETAKTLSAIIPCVLEQNDFEETYSEVLWQKLKQGTGIYGVFWDASKLHGLGDISIRRIDALNLFWEPGITDIQKSANIFHVEMVDNEALEQRYPQLKGKLGSNAFQPQHYIYDDNVSMEGKSAVIDWYYRTNYDGRTVLHYCKYVGETVLYATENDTEQPMMQQKVQVATDMATGQPVYDMQEVPAGQPMSEAGWYAHGEYPFVFDRLFPVEGSPCGFGYIDVCKSPQEQIDLLNQAITINSLMGAMPRHFMRQDGGVNEEEYCDWTKPIIHVTGNLGQDSVLPVTTTPMNGNYITILNNKITELKEVTGNTDASNGITGSVTSASGIAAQQEASGKTSRAATMSAYRAFGRVCNQVIELIRQFYDAPRQFRITGEMGQEQFQSFDNAGMQPQMQGMDFGVDMGYRLPVFDVKISAQSNTVYTKNAQNEWIIALYNLGIFNPQMVDQALMVLDSMDFDGKDELIGKVSQAATMAQLFAQVSQIALALAEKYEPQTAEALAQIIMARQPVDPATGAASPNIQIPTGGGQEIRQVRNAREMSRGAAQPKE